MAFPGDFPANRKIVRTVTNNRYLEKGDSLSHQVCYQTISAPVASVIVPFGGGTAVLSVPSPTGLEIPNKNIRFTTVGGGKILILREGFYRLTAIFADTDPLGDLGVTNGEEGITIQPRVQNAPTGIPAVAPGVSKSFFIVNPTPISGNQQVEFVVYLRNADYIDFLATNHHTTLNATLRLSKVVVCFLGNNR